MQPGVATSQTMGGKLSQYSQPLQNKKCSSANEGSTQSILYSEVYDY